MKPAARKYTLTMLVALMCYGIILFGVNSYLANHQNALPDWELIALAVLPMVPVFLVLKAIIVFVRTWDELRRRIYMESVIISFAIVGMGTFAYGFLEGVGFPPLPSIWIMPALIGIQGIAQFFVARRYQ